MLNRKDLLGGVVLGTALSCVLCVGAMTSTPSHGNAMYPQRNISQDAANSQAGAAQQMPPARASAFDNTASPK